MQLLKNYEKDFKPSVKLNTFTDKITLYIFPVLPKNYFHFHLYFYIFPFSFNITFQIYSQIHFFRSSFVFSKYITIYR